MRVPDTTAPAGADQAFTAAMSCRSADVRLSNDPTEATRRLEFESARTIDVEEFG